MSLSRGVGISNEQLDHAQKSIFISASEMSGKSAGAGASLGTGLSVFAEIGAINIEGVAMTTADAVGDFRPLPDDMDRSQKVYARIHFAHDEASAKANIDWSLEYTEIKDGLSITNPEAGSALLFPAESTTANASSLEKTGYLSIPANTFDAGSWLAVSCILVDKGTATIDKLFLLGYELKYTPLVLNGPNAMFEGVARSGF